MNVPTGVAMISITFPDPFEKSRALALYGVLGAIGGVLGIIIGGLLTTYVSWRWGECPGKIRIYLLTVYLCQSFS